MVSQEIKTTSYKVKSKRQAIDLYLCTVYKGPEYTPEIKFNYAKLQNTPNINLHFLGVEAGYFSHRHKRDVPDTEQIKWRDEYLKNVPVGSWLLVLDDDEAIGGALDRIPDVLHMAEANNVDYCMITEIRSDFNLKLRPRFIYKRYENMTYGGPTQKHDVIWTCKCHNKDHRSVPCGTGYNYIDVDADERSWILDFLYFAHYKNGYGMVIFSEKNTPKIPDNLVRLEDVE